MEIGKKTIWVLLYILLCCVVLVTFWKRHQEDDVLQKGIAQKIIRFHVIANSNEEVDQQLKLKVKERVVSSLEPALENVKSVEEAKRVLQNNLAYVEETAREVLQNQQCDLPVTARISKEYFPVKTYGEYMFPDGEYQALKIVIGEGEGKNWWCVMYPKLCFVDSLYTVVPDKTKQSLKAQLTEEEYEEILHGKKPLKVKWKVLEWLTEL